MSPESQSTLVLFPERAKLQQLKLAAGRPPAPSTEEIIRQYRQTCGGVPADIEVFAPKPAGYTAAELHAERNRHVWRELTTGWGNNDFGAFLVFCAFIGFVLSSVWALIFQGIAPGSMTIGLFLWNFPLFSALVLLVCALIGAPSSKSMRDFAPSWRATHVVFSPSMTPCVFYQDGSSEYLPWGDTPPWASGEQLVDYLREKDRTALAMYEVESTL